MRNVLCPLCKAAEYESQDRLNSKEEEFKVVKCRNCAHLFTLIPYEVDEVQLYCDKKYKVVDNRGSIFDKVIGHESRKILKTLRTLGIHRNSIILDFGCGKGKFLAEAKFAGYTTLGVETSIPRAKFAMDKYALTVSTEYYTSGRFDTGPFDVISLFHVLEHFPSPKGIMENLVRDNLKDNGVLIIEVPNIESWQARMAGDEWEHLDRPRHISHFSIEKLREFLQSIGCKTVRKETFSIRVGILGMFRFLLGKFGYKEDITYTLKNKKNLIVYISMIFLLPPSIFIELLSCLFGKGGVLRVYAIKG